MPSAMKKSPMFAPAASARCGRNATIHAPMGDEEQVDDDQRRPRAPEREAEAAPGDVGRAVAGRVLDSPVGRKRNGTTWTIARPDEHEGDGHQRDPVQ